MTMPEVVLSALDEQQKLELEEIEVKLVTEGIYHHYGFDFRDYSLPSLRRRLWKRVYAEGLSTISGLQEKVLHDSSCMERLLTELLPKFAFEYFACWAQRNILGIATGHTAQ